MATVAQPEVFGLYLEQPVGTFVKIGELSPGGKLFEGLPLHTLHYYGASGDLSRVLFSTFPGSRWPFDTTEGGETLYEYTGVEQPGEVREPRLVGVEGARGSTALISRCGTRLGSTAVEEGDGGFGSVYNAISADGGRVFFTAIGGDHDACGAAQPPVDEVFVREATPPPGESQSPELSTHPVSCPVAPLAPCADANFEGASQDGSKVFFTSTEKLVEGASEDTTSSDSAQGCSATAGAGGCNLYEDELTGSGAALTQRLVLVSAGSASPEVQGVARISEDGSHVYFVAKGVLTSEPRGGCLSELTPAELVEEEATKEGRCRAKKEANNLYVYSAGHTSFVVTLSPGDGGDWGRNDVRPVLASGEGRYLVFTSGADLLEEGVSVGKTQVFQYDAATGALARASIGEAGYDNDGKNPFAGSQISTNFPTSHGSGADSPTLANADQAGADGAVFFESPDALTPQALSDRPDSGGQLIPNVYEYRAGHVYLLSDGRDVATVNNDPSTFLIGSDASGGDVFFFTSDPLIAADGNTQQDLYDARVDGGLAPPPLALGCSEACQGALAAAPVLAAPGGSATQASEAEAPPPLAAPAPGKAPGMTPAQIRAGKLDKALRACRKKPKRTRASCERKARRAYGKVNK